MSTGTRPYGDCWSTLCCLAVWSIWVESSTALGGFRVLKKTSEAPYTTKVNYRGRTSRGTTQRHHLCQDPSPPHSTCTDITPQCSPLFVGTALFCALARTSIDAYAIITEAVLSMDWTRSRSSSRSRSRSAGAGVGASTHPPISDLGGPCPGIGGCHHGSRMGRRGVQARRPSRSYGG